MQSPTPSMPPRQHSPSIAEAGAQVCEMLSGRMTSPTPELQRRLIKTLERLHPAANEALAGTADSGPAGKSASFDDILAQLSNA